MCRLRAKFFEPVWRRIIGVGIVALLALGASNALAQPANDNFANATDLTPFDVNGTGALPAPDNNTGATRETGEPLIVTNSGGASVWYTWTAPSNGIISFDTIGSSFNTILGVYVGDSVDALALIAQDDDSGGSGTSKVTFNAAVGTTFHIAVDGFNGAVGNIALKWATTEPAVTPPNDKIANAIVLNGSSGTIFGFNLLATSEAFEFPIVFGTNSVWYSWTAPADGVVTFDTHGSSFDTILDLYPGTNQPSVFLRSENDDFLEKRTSQVSLVVSSGTTYRISVNGFNGAEGFLRLDWNLAPLPSNDNFANAANLDTSALAGSISANNVGATAEAGEPTHAGFASSQSLWYKVVAPQDGEVQLDTIGSSIDTVVAVYTGSSLATLSQVAANDDLYPTFSVPGTGQAGQLNQVAQGIDTTNIPIPPGVLIVSPTNPTPPPNVTL